MAYPVAVATAARALVGGLAPAIGFIAGVAAVDLGYPLLAIFGLPPCCMCRAAQGLNRASGTLMIGAGVGRHLLIRTSSLPRRGGWP